jgi:hypothetical protein
VYDASARFNAARDTYATIHHQLLPKVEQTYEAVRSEFGTPGGSAAAVLNAFHLVLDARLSEERAFAEVALALADLERALGVPLADAVAASEARHE